MRDLNDKNTGDSLTASEWNDMPSELQAVIEDLGIVLSGGDLRQLQKAITTMTHAATFYAGGGIADVYTAVKIGAKEGLSLLATISDGALVRFLPAANNTGASTLDVNGLTAKDITREDGSVLAAGDLITTRDAWVRWDQGADDWLRQDFALPVAPINGAHLTTTAAIATTSGTQHDFTGIPDYVRRITMSFDNVQTDNAAELLVQIGPVGGIEATGYESNSGFESSNLESSTAGFVILRVAASDDMHGHMVLTRVDALDWVSSHVLHLDTTGRNAKGGGRKTLAGTLTQVRLTAEAGNFNQGQVCIHYE